VILSSSNKIMSLIVERSWLHCHRIGMYRSYKSINGFTIVELLIVVVVIAILAAISIIAYNGIQTRAENTKTITAVNQYVKGVLAYSADKGQYPSDPSWPCLGPDGTRCARASGDGAGCPSSDGGSITQINFINQLKTVMGDNMPPLSSQIVSCASSTYSGGYYRSTDGKVASIIYYLRGNQPCDGVSGAASYGRNQQNDMTRCSYAFTNL